MKINVKDLKRRIAIYNYFVWRQQRERGSGGEPPRADYALKERGSEPLHPEPP